MESPELAHEISKDYPAYTASETDTVLASIESPFYCTTFEGYHPEGCEGCVHKGLYNSPISLCIEVKEAPVQSDVVEVQNQITKPDPKPDPNPNLLTPALNVYTIPDYPGDYFRGADGGIYLRTLDKKKKPTEILVYRQPLYPVRRLVDPQRGPCYVFRHHTAREGIREFVGVGTDLSSPEGFRNLMGINDVFLLREDLGNLMTYVKKWIIELQDNMDEINVRTQFGWTEDYASFVVGDKEILGHTLQPTHRVHVLHNIFLTLKAKELWRGGKKLPHSITDLSLKNINICLVYLLVLHLWSLFLILRVQFTILLAQTLGMVKLLGCLRELRCGATTNV